MKKQIILNCTPQETRVAILESGQLAEIYIERMRSRGVVGNVYKARVQRVLPGMQAAFVDIGFEKAAFLHASDFLHELPDLSPLVTSEPASSGGDVENEEAETAEDAAIDGEEEFAVDVIANGDEAAKETTAGDSGDGAERARDTESRPPRRSRACRSKPSSPAARRSSFRSRRSRWVRRAHASPPT